MSLVPLLSPERGYFPRNVWYIAGFSSELRDKPLARRICGHAVVMFRTAGGRAVALEDRCVHRGMPLSAGERDGDIIRCAYHGLEFDASGACTKIPGQARIPPGARVRSFPLVERDALLWIWPGDQEKADESLIVSRPYHTAPDWACVFGTLEVKANWQLIADNLLNLSHLQYVHKKTIGGDPDADDRAEVTVVRDGNRVRVTRWLLNVEPPPLHRMARGYTGPIDRWQEFEFEPCVLQFHSGAKEAGTGAREGRRDGAMDLRHFHAPTPQGPHSTLYFFTRAHNFRLDDAELTEKMRRSMLATFEEDKAVIEAQQARLLETEDEPLIDLRDDAANLHARRIVRQLMAQEDAAETSGRHLAHA
jgi:phenylpropionate dioxygenase-like ring-hydroxylating dioxygenase large terminal subunit